MVGDHMRDVTDLFTALVNGTLPAVSYVKSDGAIDGHPFLERGPFRGLRDNPPGTHCRTSSYPHFATLILGSKTRVSQSQEGASN
jgi:hypothetical protein